MKLNAEDKKRLMLEAYEHQKEVYRNASKEHKHEYIGRRNQAAVYAKNYDLDNMRPEKFAETVNRLHPTVEITAVSIDVDYTVKMWGNETT